MGGEEAKEAKRPCYGVVSGRGGELIVAPSAPTEVALMSQHTASSTPPMPDTGEDSPSEYFMHGIPE